MRGPAEDLPKANFPNTAFLSKGYTSKRNPISRNTHLPAEREEAVCLYALYLTWPVSS